MSRNGAGTYTLPAGNPVVAGTTISSSWANLTLEDIRDELTNSLDRNGRGAMAAALKLFDGTSGAPGLSFSTETNTGFYRAGAGDIRFVLAGSQFLRFNAGDVFIYVGGLWKQLVSIDDVLDMTFDDLVAASLTITADDVTINGAPLADYNTRVAVRKNGTGATVGTRRRINFIEGLGTTITVTDDGTDEEVDVTIANAALSSEYAYTAQGTNFTAVSNKRYLLTATGLTITLPASPSDSEYIYFASGVDMGSTTTTLNRNGKTIMGLSENMDITEPHFCFGIMYYAAGGDWRIVR